MATSTLLTIDDFERLPAEMAENHELVDGALVDVSGKNPEHNLLRDYLGDTMRVVVRNGRLGKVITEQEYDFQGNAYGPDVTFFGNDKIALIERHMRVQR